MLGDPLLHAVARSYQPALSCASCACCLRCTSAISTPSDRRARRRADDVGAFDQFAHRLFSAPTSPQQDSSASSERVERIDLLAPVIVRRIFEQRLLVAHQFFVEQAAAVEGVLAQHALAPGVDGEDGRFVHRLRRQLQAVRSLLLRAVIGIGFQQRVEIVVALLAPRACGSTRPPPPAVRARGWTARAWRRG
jgi:hypothetical protein